jgi:hypothetical protein
MDIPLFHLDGMGNRMLIAVIAITHVVINHPMAVGAYPLITAMEWLGLRSKDERWDNLAKRITFITFLITSSVGALSGVGIWLSSALVSPFGIGSLLRVFFWNWLFEWGIFISEVILILAYYLTWDKCKTAASKKAHIYLGVVLSVFSWITMAVIVAILGFMMSSGAWTNEQSVWSATMNPLYIPQLTFRTFFALATAGLYVWFLIAFLLKKSDPMRDSAVKFTAGWTLLFAPFCMLAAVWYWQRVPEMMSANADVALLTQKFAEWQSQFIYIAASVIAILIMVAIVGLVKPRFVPTLGLVATSILAIGLLGHFERVREFIRKPYIIADYMYSNGVRVDQLALFQQEGILTHSTYSSIGPITDENRVDAGKHVFMLTCTRCHTTNRMNGVVQKFEKLYGKGQWDIQQVSTFISSMHLTRTYMPPFPGSPDEAKALAAFICNLQESPVRLAGAQSDGIGNVALKKPEDIGPSSNSANVTLVKARSEVGGGE